MILRKGSLLFFLFVASLVSAQNVNDAGMWNAFSFSSDIKDLTPWKDGDAFKNVSFHLNPEMRFNENITQLRGYFTDIGFDKKWSKYVSSTVEYRFGARREESAYSIRKRWSIGTQLSLPIKDFKITATTRYQIAQVRTSDLDLNSTWRQKVGLEYAPWKNLSIQVSHELFFLPITLENTNWRSQIALKYKIDKSNGISLGYLVQRDLTNADTDFIILTGYKWEFNKKKEKSTPAVQ
jgi:hypothetical protein